MSRAGPILVNAFAMATPTHLVPGSWRHPDSQAHRYAQLSYWTELAQLLERGRFDGLFIADVVGVYDVFEGGPEAALRGGTQIPMIDPMLVVSAMAHVTTDLGFGITASTSYEPPYLFARRMSTLDHLTDGRVAWNIVTSYLNSGAVNVGRDAQSAHADRYAIAEEYLEVLYELWEASWEDDAVVRDAAAGVYADPDRIHPIAHHGEHFRVPGIHMCEPSPQRTPVLYQAGSSTRGRQFAAEHAEAVFVMEPTAEIVAGRIADIRARAVAAGRGADAIRAFSGYGVIVGATRAEARRRHDACRRLTDPGGALALWSGWLGQDLAGLGLDDPVDAVPNDAIRSLSETFGAGHWRLGDVIDRLSLRPDGPVAVGDAAQVADRIEEWVAATDSDGLNLWHAVAPGSYADFVEYVVPELQRRGRYRDAYAPGTLREKLLGGGPRLPPSHPAARVRGALAQSR
jgi:long-chain alkane monooxygenase